MAKRIRDLTQSKLRCLFYGRAGTGKTRLVGTAALFEPTSPALLLTIGGNPVSLLDYLKKPEIVEVTSMKDFDDFYDFFAAGQTPEHPLWAGLEMTEPFKTLIIDGGSEVNQKVLDLITDRKADSFGQIPGDTDPGHYRKNLEMMGYWASCFMGLADRSNVLPVHVLMTALERDPALDLRSSKARAEGIRGPSPENLLYRPHFIGQAITVVESYAYVVGRMMPAVRFDVKQQKSLGVYKTPDVYNVCLFQPGPDYAAKDQTGRLGTHMADPTIEEIWKAIYDVR